ncbi:UNVERIFIED_CONTAM: hypothetical protein Sradi_1824100 [Sesamum radiatum]|uniref:Uncharacterized protein n=1 Tax=Sesamum radiatum TaxID=300843 RepID=A0AAW2TWB1_SESRA
MDVSARAMVEAIHASPTQAVLYLSGGASQALGWLMSVPGASNTVLEAVVPYSRMSMIQLLGKPKYYSGDYGRMLEILCGCKSTGCVFLVGGRTVNGDFRVLDDFDIPQELRDMFIPIPADKFRIDISSTEIRRSQGML